MRISVYIFSILQIFAHATEHSSHANPPKCGKLTEISMRSLLDQFGAALRTGKSQTVVDLYRNNNPLLIATLDNVPISNTRGLTAYFDKFLLNSPDATVIQTFIFPDGNIVAGLYNFEVNVMSEKCAPKKCGPTISIQCSQDCRTVVPARFTFFYECNNNIWKISHHHSSKLPISNNTTSNVHHAWN